MKNVSSDLIREINREYFKHLDSVSLYIKVKTILKAIKCHKFWETMTLKINKKKYFDTFSKKQICEEKEVETNKRIVVYMCIVGSYDKLLEPLYVSENTDYYLFTDMDVPKNSMWKKREINRKDFDGLSDAEINRYIKLHPDEFFAEYDYSIYIDGNIRIMADIREIINCMEVKGKVYAVHRHPDRDCVFTEANYLMHLKRFKAIKSEIKKQVENYRKAGFEAHRGLYENSIIARKHNDVRCIELMREWWQQMQLYTMRDQLSFPYAMKVCGWTEDDIHVLGYNLKRNDRFRYYFHMM